MLHELCEDEEKPFTVPKIRTEEGSSSALLQVTPSEQKKEESQPTG
jgi:hypothetical protein